MTRQRYGELDGKSKTDQREGERVEVNELLPKQSRCSAAHVP
jgi:hypothetical protein